MYQGYKIIDADAHFYEPWDIWDRYVEPFGETRTTTGTLGTEKTVTGQISDGTGLYGSRLLES